jgi:Flp pilus assembly CpaE family ATPase
LLHPSLTRVVVAIEDLALHQEVLDFVARDGRVDVVGAVTDVDQLGRILRRQPLDALICCSQLAPRAGEQRSGTERIERPRLYLVGPELTVPLLRNAIALGADGAFRWPEERQALGDQLRRRRASRFPSGPDSGSVIAVHGARGGAGTTFVACQLAAAFSARSVPTVLVDAGLALPDVAAALAVPPDRGIRTISDLAPVVDEVSEEHLAKVLFPCPAGFEVLLAPFGGGEVGPAAALIGASLSTLRTSHAVVVVHTARALDAATDEALRLADVVLLVTALDLFSLHGAKRLIQRSGAPDQGRVHIVVNEASRPCLPVGDVERVLGMSPVARIRFDPAVSRSQQRGELLRPRSGRAARDVERLATWLLARQSPAAGKVS